MALFFNARLAFFEPRNSSASFSSGAVESRAWNPEVPSSSALRGMNGLCNSYSSNDG